MNKERESISRSCHSQAALGATEKLEQGMTYSYCFIVSLTSIVLPSSSKTVT